MKNVASKDEMEPSANNAVDEMKDKPVKQTTRKTSSARKKLENKIEVKDSGYEDNYKNMVIPENMIKDAEPIPFGRRISKINMPTDSFIRIDSAIESQKLLEQFVNEILIADVDYGFIQGYGKPTLLKGGAEKICNFYHLIPKVEVMSRVDDYNLPFFSREVKITLYESANNTVRAEGLGACNSMEAKYRREDAYSLQNTILKVAKKRSLIDAVLNVSTLSSRFTQDIEDIEALEGAITVKKPITMKQYKYISDLIKNNGISREEYYELLSKEFQVESLKQMDSAQVSQLIKLLKNRK